ncbi:hypothetical protein KFK09_014825 [Dendrobium nobile]|uniref:Uncharacterized protein n=1 Tax=Dendrobium nobile TaxID=94219 RepID=A0A8T3B464_DENNO|nr:hypothetical protein KFK09_014825 [Dendrobium nobile]
MKKNFSIRDILFPLDPFIFKNVLSYRFLQLLTLNELHQKNKNLDSPTELS